jgi:tetratricopeptide (TPR) repeat protein
VVAFYHLGDYRQTIEEGQEARSYVNIGDLATVAYYVGLANDRLGQYAAAARWLEEAASVETGGLSGVAQVALVDLYTRILAQRNDSEVMLKLGVLLYRRERYIEALATLQALINQTAYPPAAFYWIGLTNVRMAEGFTSLEVRRRYHFDARQALQRYLELEPNGSFARDARRLLQALSKA